MSYFFLIPISIMLGLTGLGAFFWAIRNNQYDDLDGAAARILITTDLPLPILPTMSRSVGKPSDTADHAEAVIAGQFDALYASSKDRSAAS